jgi:hypothetical protein
LKRTATLYRKSKDGEKAFYIDDKNAQIIFDFLDEDNANLKKFLYVLELLLEGHPPRDLYDKENIDKNCEHITAIKLFKGTKNPRIYCQQYTAERPKHFVIVAIELLTKKKSNKNTNKEKSIIRRVARYKYTLTDEPK